MDCPNADSVETLRTTNSVAVARTVLMTYLPRIGHGRRQKALQKVGLTNCERICGNTTFCWEACQCESLCCGSTAAGSRAIVAASAKLRRPGFPWPLPAGCRVEYRWDERWTGCL